MKIVISLILLCSFTFAQWRVDLGLGFNYTQVNNDAPFVEWLGKVNLGYNSNIAGSIGGMFNTVKQDNDIGWVLDAETRFDIGYVINRMFKLYILNTYEVRESMKLTYRYSIGAGGKYTYYKNDYLDCSISLIPMYNRETYSDGLELKRGVRLSFRSKVIAELDKEAIGFRSIIFYKPLIDDFASYIIDIDNAIYFKLYGDVSLEFAHIFDLDINRKYKINERKSKYILNLVIAI